MPELDLATELRDLGAHLDVADDDLLADRVVATIERSSFRAPAVARRRRRLVLAVVAAAVAAAGGVAAPAVADWVRERIGGVEVQRVPTTVPPSLTTALDLGRPVSRREAEDEAPFPVKTLRDPGRPATGVWIDDVDGIVVVSLLYSPDVLVQEFAAGFDQRTVMGKMAGPDVTIERVTVDGHAGLWLEGGHGIFLVDGQGLRFVESRLAANTLVWEADGVTYRLESSLDRAAAVALAGTLG